MSSPAVLYYVHDPMCSWCWGFRPILTELLASLPHEVRVQRLLGGLAPDTDRPMPREMQERLQDTWRRIQRRIPGTEFNFAFWQDCRPRRSTYPACRAVIAARRLSPAHEAPMILAIQRAYYTRALNPSDDETLLQLAAELGLPRGEFQRLLEDERTERQLQREIAFARSMDTDSFPSLVLQTAEHSRCPVAVDYNDARGMLDGIRTLID
jgi:putative protein-disulfide isomerase